MDDLGFNWNQQAQKPAIPSFFSEAVQNNYKSAQAGHPIFEDRDFVRVIIPGDMRSTPVYEVNEEHKARWPREYEAFKKGQEPPTEGTPLTQWPPIGAARAKTFAAMHITTIEQLAAVQDNILGNLGMGARALREEARVFLDVAKNGTAPIARLVGRVEALETAKATDAEALSAAHGRIAELEAELAAKPKGKARAA